MQHGSPAPTRHALAEHLATLRRDPSRRGLWSCLATGGEELVLRACPAGPARDMGCAVCLAELGTETTLDHLADFLGRAAHSGLPVLILGEPGVGREDVARALHLLDPRRTGPFIALDAGALEDPASAGDEIEERLERESHRGRSGTLLVGSADRLPEDLQARLGSWLRYGFRAAARPGGRGGAAARLVVSAASAALHPHLLREVDFLRLEIAPLRRRRGAIRTLTAHYARLYGDGRPLGDEVMAALTAYTWPGNRDELRHVVARLAALVPSQRARLSDLRALAPELTSRLGRHGVPKADAATLARHLARDGADEERGGEEHPTPVSRALRYLAEHYRETIRLPALARACCTSPSHLCHLFRRHAGTSPIAFLNLLRVEHAKRLLADDLERSVTRIAADVGFGDLRHFERTFKRHTGCTPQRFRQP